LGDSSPLTCHGEITSNYPADTLRQMLDINSAA
jgi:hypothetical protein